MYISSKTLWVLLLGALSFVANAQISTEETLYPRKMVVEKATGTWCKWCPIGIVAMEKMAEKYPDNFIGIDVHIRDEMTSQDYLNFDMGRNVPTSHINRTEKSLYPVFTVLDSYYSAHTAPINAKVETTIVKKDETSYILESYVTLGYSTNTAKYNLAYVILEDKVGPYLQINAYAGGTREVGGWEKKGHAVSMLYDNVARVVLPNVTGAGNGIPSMMERDVPKKKILRIEPARYVTNLENAKVVTLLLNGETGEIVNADLDGLANVTTVSTPLLQENGSSTEAIYDLYGRKIPYPQKGLQIVGGKKMIY